LAGFILLDNIKKIDISLVAIFILIYLIYLLNFRELGFMEDIHLMIIQKKITLDYQK